MEKADFIQTCSCLTRWRSASWVRFDENTRTSKLDYSAELTPTPGRLKICTVGNRDSQPTLVVASFGRAVAELSRKRRRLGHVMLADSLKIIYIAVYWEFLSVIYLKKP